MLGRVIAGKYRLTRFIGAGGMGTIFEGTDLSLNRSVAVKLLRSSMIQDDKSVQRFQREGKAVSRLNHPNIVNVYDFGMHNEVQPYLVMEYVVGEALSSILERQRCLKIERALDLANQVCQGLDHAHHHKVIHRDLKPGNILISQHGKDEIVKIVDFGIAKIASEDGTIQNLTTTGEIFGSPLYMSPEQCSGFSLDGRSDIYSLGCVLYECLTGIPPHVGDSPLVTIAKHQNEQPLSLREASLGSNFPEDLERIVAKMLAKQPIDRYLSAAALEFEITNLLEGKTYQPAPEIKIVSQAEQFQRDGAATSFRHFQNIKIAKVEDKPRLARKPAKLIVASLCMVALACFLGVALWIANQLSEPNTTARKYPVLQMSKHEQRIEQQAFRDDPRLEWDQYQHYPGLAQMESFKAGLFEPADGQWVLLKRMPKLLDLDLSTSNFGDSDVQYIVNLPIVRLNLQDTRVTNKGVESLKSMSKLKVLNLGRDELSDAAFANLPPNLRELSCVMDTKIKGPGLRNLVMLRKLRSLNFHDAGLTDDAVPNLLMMKNLEYLDIAKTLISSSGCKRLKTLLPNCLIITSQDSSDFENWVRSTHQSMLHED